MTASKLTKKFPGLLLEVTVPKDTPLDTGHLSTPLSI